MVSKGLAGAAALAMALASAGAFAPGAAFLKAPLSPATHWFNRVVNSQGSIVTSDMVSQHTEGWNQSVHTMECCS
jgi:hypothetical protein